MKRAYVPAGPRADAMLSTFPLDTASTMAFFRCTPNEAVQLATDRDVMRDVFDWFAHPLLAKVSPW